MALKRVASNSAATAPKKTRFTDPEDDPGNFAEQIDSALEDSTASRRKGRIKNEGYDSDSSDDGEGVVNSRKKKMTEQEDDGDDMFADTDAKKAAPEGSSNKQETSYMRLGDIEGQEFGAAHDGDQSEDTDDPDDTATADRKLKDEMGFEISQFNMREELEEGKMTEDGTYTKSFDAHAVHDRWMEGVGEKEMQLARKRKRQAERAQREKMAAEEREMEQLGGEGALEIALLSKLKKGETVLEALQRLGANAKRKSDKSISTEIEHFTHLASTIMSQGDTDIYSKTHEELVRIVRSFGKVPLDWQPPSADVRYEYKWDIPGQSTDDTIFGPFKEEELLSWHKASYFGVSGEQVKVRQLNGEWGEWDNVVGT